MNPETTKRPWGSFTRYTNNQLSTVKILNIIKGEEFSLQYHNKRSEFWKVIKGTPVVTVGEEKIQAKEGDEFNIGIGVKHRISSVENDAEVLEISKGEFDEEDIVRLEDKYGRVT